jgi:DNA-binding MurR/RpiR family transcriptional regulator
MDREASPLELIRAALPGMQGARRRVAEFMLEHAQDVATRSITWLAEQTDASAATISRLATALGFEGYPELRAAIANENGRGAQAGWEQDIGSAITPDDPAEKVLSVLAGNQFGAARNAMASLDLPALERVADRIAHARRVHLFGEWGDLAPSQELYLRLLRIGIPVWLHEGAYAARVGASMLEDTDVALTICRSGDSEIATRFLQVAASHGAMTVVITGAPDTALAASAEEVIFTGTRVGSSWTDYFAGRSSDALVGGVLWALVAQRVPDSAYNRLRDLDPHEAPEPGPLRH